MSLRNHLADALEQSKANDKLGIIMNSDNYNKEYLWLLRVISISERAWKRDKREKLLENFGKTDLLKVP